METNTMHAPVKAVAMLILLLMLTAVLYAGYMAIWHWSGIGV